MTRYLITHQGSISGVGGTSASTPALAGIVALLNQSQMSKGLQRQPGLGNINPQLYRLAQTAPRRLPRRRRMETSWFLARRERRTA